MQKCFLHQRQNVKKYVVVFVDKPDDYKTMYSMYRLSLDI